MAVAFFLLAAPAFVRADTAKTYNIFLSGNLSGLSSDVEGRTAIGGAATLSNYSLGATLPGAPTLTALVVAGRLTDSNGSIYGNAFVGGTSVLSNVNFANGGTLATGSGGLNFANEVARLHSLSDNLAALTADGTTNNTFGQLTLTGVKTGLNVFYVAGSALSTANGVSIIVPAGAFAVINIDGAADQFANLGVTSTSGATRDLFNFYTATSLFVGGITVEGSILAPQASVTATSGAINGQLIAYSLSSGGQPTAQIIMYCSPERFWLRAASHPRVAVRFRNRLHGPY